MMTWNIYIVTSSQNFYEDIDDQALYYDTETNNSKNKDTKVLSKVSVSKPKSNVFHLLILFQ